MRASPTRISALRKSLHREKRASGIKKKRQFRVNTIIVFLTATAPYQTAWVGTEPMNRKNGNLISSLPLGTTWMFRISHNITGKTKKFLVGNNWTLLCLTLRIGAGNSEKTYRRNSSQAEGANQTRLFAAAENSQPRGRPRRLLAPGAHRTGSHEGGACSPGVCEYAQPDITVDVSGRHPMSMNLPKRYQKPTSIASKGTGSWLCEVTVRVIVDRHDSNCP
jgi:hypothetical protein